MKLTLETTPEQDEANTRAIKDSSIARDGWDLEKWYQKLFNDAADAPIMQYKQNDLEAVKAKLQEKITALQPQDLADVLAIVEKYNAK